MDWIEEVHTDPLLLEIITSFWCGEDVVFDTDCDKYLQSIYNIIFLPVGMINFQEQYYYQICSKKSAKHWGSNLVKKC